MLPDFVRIKKKRLALFREHLMKETMQRSCFPPTIKTVQQHEGRRTEYTTIDGYDDKVTYDNRISTSVRFQPEDLPVMDEHWLAAKAGQMGEKMARQQAQVFFSKLDETTEQAGNVLDAAGRMLDPMMLIECMEKVTIDFDENGHPMLPTLLAGTVMADRLIKVQAEAEQSPEFRARWDELMQRKWAEYRDREADRKLVD